LEPQKQAEKLRLKRELYARLSKFLPSKLLVCGFSWIFLEHPPLDYSEAEPIELLNDISSKKIASGIKQGYVFIDGYHLSLSNVEIER
jgi:hypothetical protein